MDRNDYVVGWFTLALINANLANIKGRSRLAWFLVSVIVGPVATFVLLFVEAATAAGPQK